MTNITLTRFNVKPKSYGWQDQYKASVYPDQDHRHWDIEAYLKGLLIQMRCQPNEPAAWSFSEWTQRVDGNNSKDNWLRATAIALEFRSTPQIVDEILDRTEALGYTHVLIDSVNRAGKATATIVFPLTETIDFKQYARLASVLLEELGVYGATSGNMAMTHLIHINSDSTATVRPGAILSPRHKIADTADLYKSKNPERFTHNGPAAAVQLMAPVSTSHDGLFSGLNWND